MSHAEELLLTGTATYRERMAIPADAALYVELLDTSLADAPSLRISGMAFPTGGRVPVEFSLPYQSALISENLRYTVRAELKVGRKVLFRTTSAYPVLTRGADSQVELLLVRASGEGLAVVPDRATAGTGPSTADLDGKWIAVSLGRQTVIPNVSASLVLAAGGTRVQGNAGCNNFQGGAKVEGDAIKFGMLAMTMKACVDEAIGDQERRFAKALESARHFKVDGTTLRLLDGQGQGVLSFKRSN